METYRQNKAKTRLTLNDPLPSSNQSDLMEQIHGK